MRAFQTSLSRPQPSRFWDGLGAENEFKGTWEPSKNRFLDFTHVAFWAGQEEENEFQCKATTTNIDFSKKPKSNFGLIKSRKWLLSAIRNLNRRFIDFEKVTFSDVQVVENDFKVTFDNLNHRFFNFIQIAFWANPEAQNKFRFPCETLKYSFFDLTQVAFWDGQEAESEFKVSCDHLKHRFLDFTIIAFWAGQEEKWFPNAWGTLETSLSWPQKSRILGLSRGR